MNTTDTAAIKAEVKAILTPAFDKINAIIATSPDPKTLDDAVVEMTHILVDSLNDKSPKVEETKAILARFDHDPAASKALRACSTLIIDAIKDIGAIRRAAATQEA